MARFKPGWVDFYRANQRHYTDEDLPWGGDERFRFVGKGTYEFAGERFEFPPLPNGGEQDRLMCYTYCRYVKACKKNGVEPEPFERVEKDS